MPEGIADDVTWHGLAAGPLSGTYHGRDEGLGLSSAGWPRRQAGTFRLAVHDVLANDEHTVVLCTMLASRGNKSIEIPVVNVSPRPRWQDHRVLGRIDRPAGEHRLLVLSGQPGHVRRAASPGWMPIAMRGTPGREHGYRAAAGPGAGPCRTRGPGSRLSSRRRALTGIPI